MGVAKAFGVGTFARCAAGICGSPVSGPSISRKKIAAISRSTLPGMQVRAPFSIIWRKLPRPRIVTERRDAVGDITAAILSQSCFLVLPNDLPETFRGAQTCCSVVVRVGDARMGVVQKRAGEIRVLAAVDGGAGGPRGAKQMRAHCYTHGRKGGHSDHFATCLSVIGAPSFAESQRAEGALSDRASTGLCWPR